MSNNMHDNAANAETSSCASADGWSAAMHLKAPSDATGVVRADEGVQGLSRNVLFFGDAPMEALRIQLAKALRN
jgi:hypothetical protein